MSKVVPKRVTAKMLAQVGCLFGAQFLASTASLGAQETPASSVPSVFSTLHGAWDGSGVLSSKTWRWTSTT